MTSSYIFILIFIVLNFHNKLLTIKKEVSKNPLDNSFYIYAIPSNFFSDDFTLGSPNDIASIPHTNIKIG